MVVVVGTLVDGLATSTGAGVVGVAGVAALGGATASFVASTRADVGGGGASFGFALLDDTFDDSSTTFARLLLDESS